MAFIPPGELTGSRENCQTSTLNSFIYYLCVATTYTIEGYPQLPTSIRIYNPYQAIKQYGKAVTGL
jgi:hypothetical protein